MRAGMDAIVQACLRNDKWLGYADILQRVEVPSALGAWSYEVYDTKLARQTKAGTILQLAVYSDLLADVQGLRPAHFHVVTPDVTIRCSATGWPTTKRISARSAGSWKGRCGHDERVTASITYPEPVDHCEVCRWFLRCEAQRRKDDHLCYVAGLSRLHRRELHSQGITTLTELAQMPVPLTFKPSRGSKATLRAAAGSGAAAGSESANEASRVCAAAAWSRAGAVPVAAAEQRRCVSRSRRRSVRPRGRTGIPVWDECDRCDRCDRPAFAARRAAAARSRRSSRASEGGCVRCRSVAAASCDCGGGGQGGARLHRALGVR